VVSGFDSLENTGTASYGSKPVVSVQASDTVVLVAPPGPGSEKTIARHIDNLFKAGADVYPELTSWRHPFGTLVEKSLSSC